MASPEDYLSINRESWNERVDAHLGSSFYDVPAFIAGRSSLNAPELYLLGDVRGKKILHLQCHFGQDSISLARMGAEVTGVDFSDKAINAARELASQANTDVDFICTDIYSLPRMLQGKFDIVFTSYGTIGWLPDLKRWAGVVAHFLEKGGKFLIVEFHPFVWMYNRDFSAIDYSYFNRGAIDEVNDGTYAEPSAPIRTRSISWNHSLSDVVKALIESGLSINSLHEYDYSPYDIFEGMVPIGQGMFKLKGKEGMIPLLYAIEAIKNQ